MELKANEHILNNHEGFCILREINNTQKYWAMFDGCDEYDGTILGLRIKVRDDFAGKSKYHIYGTNASMQIRTKIIYRDKKGPYIKMKRKGIHKSYPLHDKYYLSNSIKNEGLDFINDIREGE